MKKTLLILLVAVTALASCKKDPEDKLKGRWDLAKSYSIYKVNGTVVSEDTDTGGDMYLVFDGNKVTMYRNGEVDSKGTFTATENSITITDEDGDAETSSLRWNSKKEFVVSSEETETVNDQTHYYKDEMTFKKH